MAMDIYGLPLTSYRLIYCCECQEDVEARLTDGKHIYPHREDLHKLPFWHCTKCGNYVGCRRKTNKPTHPLGNIPTPAMRKARLHIHAILDQIWKNKIISRKELYFKISNILGYEYHTAEIKTIEEARLIYKIIKCFKKE